MPLVRLVKPKVLVLNHHDETGGRFPDLASEPMFMAMRDEFPYVEPVPGDLADLPSLVKALESTQLALGRF